MPNRQHVIKVFKAGSKQADFSIMSVFPAAGIAKLGERLDEEAAAKAKRSFKYLSDLGAESLVFRHNGRKIKVEAAGNA